ncbi:MAG: hypothetical protein J6Y15_03050 [Bacteroidaceae bacterium]|nr:hypothetical protein [Bacteroidaceae bacterium]
MKQLTINKTILKMRKIFPLFMMMLVMASVCVFTSCGDDDKEEENIQDPAVGTWTCDDGKYDPDFGYSTRILVINSDGTCEGRIQSISDPQDEKIAKIMSANLVFLYYEGHWTVSNNQYVITTEYESCFYDYKDWEWHPSEEPVAYATIEGDKMTITSTLNEKTDTIVYIRKK